MFLERQAIMPSCGHSFEGGCNHTCREIIILGKNVLLQDDFIYSSTLKIMLVMHSSKYIHHLCYRLVVYIYAQAITCGIEVILKVNGIRLHLSWNSHSHWHVWGALNAISQILNAFLARQRNLF